MENKSHVIVAIAFLLIFGVGAAIFFYWLAHEQSARRVYVIDTSESAGGLYAQAPVKFKGLTAGKVKSVGYDPDDPNKVKIVIGVHDTVPVTTATYAQLSTQGLAGGKELILKNPNPEASPLKTSSDKPARIPLHQSLLGQLEHSGKQDMAQINAILDSLHKLLDQDNRQHLSNTIAQLDQATQGMVQAEKALMPALQQMPELARQARDNLTAIRQLTARMQTLAEQAQVPMRNAAHLENSIQSLSESADRLTRRLNDQTLPQVQTLMQHMDRSLKQVDRLIRELHANPQSLLFGGPGPRPGPGESRAGESGQ